MNDKTQIITLLREQFNLWEGFLTGIDEEQITAPNRIASLSIKDIVAHLTAWQQISVARLEAALNNGQPEYPKWLGGFKPDSEDDLDKINARIYIYYRGQPWLDIHREWRTRFLHFLEFAEAMPEKDLFEEGRYAWLNGDALSAVLRGTYEHHVEHLEPLDGLLPQSGQL